MFIVPVVPHLACKGIVKIAGNTGSVWAGGSIAAIEVKPLTGMALTM
jgi:hypothetical protein